MSTLPLLPTPQLRHLLGQAEQAGTSEGMGTSADQESGLGGVPCLREGQPHWNQEQDRGWGGPTSAAPSFLPVRASGGCGQVGWQPQAFLQSQGGTCSVSVIRAVPLALGSFGWSVYSERVCMSACV